MGKILFWIVIVFVVLFGLRMLNVAKGRARPNSASKTRPPLESMVRCGECGVFLPRAEARVEADKVLCNDPACVARRARPR